MRNINPLNLSLSFKNRIMNTFGDEGRQWLHALPSLLVECEKQYNIKIGKVVEDLSFNYVTNATQADGTEIILKLGVPNKEIITEINALKFMQGNSIVQLLDADQEKGILLLEKLVPGEMLSTISDDTKATEIAAEVMKKLWKTIDGEHSFPTTQRWFAELGQSIDVPNDFPFRLIDRASKIATELHQSMGETVLLHGDLHHFNILKASRQPWLAIDPKGVVGEREYEVGALLRNPMPDIATTMDTKKVLAYRIGLLSDLLNFDRQKLAAWGFSQAILSAVWSINGKSDDWRYGIRCAEALSGL